MDGKIRESLFFYVKIFEYNSVVRKAWRLCGHFLDQREIVLDSRHVFCKQIMLAYNQEFYKLLRITGEVCV